MELYRYQLVYNYETEKADLKLESFPVVRESEKSYWIQLSELFPERQKVVRKDARKTYAYSTQKKALYSYIRRTTNRVQYLQRDLNDAHRGLEQANILYSKLHT